MGELIHISHSLYKTYEAELDIRIETRFTYHIVYIKPNVTWSAFNLS